MPAKKHVHTYVRLKYKDKEIFGCRDPECTHELTKVRLMGKMAKCPYCAEEYVLTSDALRRRLPHCDNCTSGKRGKKPEVKETLVAASLIDRIFRSK